MEKIFNVAVDIGKKMFTPAFEVSTNDLKSVKLLITINNRQTPLSLTDTTVRIAIRKPDNHIIFQDCTVKDAANGQVEIILENQAYITPGTHTAEIMCYKGSEVVAVSGTFSYKSTKGIMNDEAVESKSEFTVINQKIEEVKKLLEDAAESGVGVDEQAREDIQQVTMQVAEATKKTEKIINVQVLGAKGDGTTDDSKAFSDAVVAVANGGRIEIPYTPNGYVSGASMLFNGKKNIEIVGVGGAVKITQKAGSNVAMVDFIKCQNISVSNLLLDVNAANQDQTKYPAYVNTGIRFDEVNNLTVRNVHVINSIRENKFKKCKNFIIENVSIDGAIVDGFSFENCSFGTGRNLSAKNVLTNGLVSDVNGFELEDGSNNIDFYDLYVENTSTAMLIKSHDGVIICEKINVTSLRAKNVEFVLRTTNNCKNLKFNGLRGSEVKSCGVRIADGKFITVREIDISGTGRGIQLQACEDVTYQNGIINTPNYPAIEFDHTTGIKDVLFDNLTLTSNENTIYTTSAHADTILRENVKFRGCKIRSTGNSTIWLLGGKWNRLKFDGCTILVPEGAKRILLDKSNGIDFINTDIKSLSQTAVSIRFYGDDINFIGGNIEAVTKAIRLGDEETGTALFNNITFQSLTIKNAQYGIFTKGNETAWVKNVKISDCTFINTQMFYWYQSQFMDGIILTGNKRIGGSAPNAYTGTNLVASGNYPVIA